MAVLVYEERPPDYSAGARATRAFNVSGATDEDGASGATGVPAPGDAHPQDSTLIAQRPIVTRLGPDYWRVVVPYALYSGGFSGVEGGTMLRWSWQRIAAEYDVDKDGNPITNAADTPYVPALQGEIAVAVIEIVKEQLTGFVPAQAATYMERGGAINTDSFAVGGVTIALAGQARVEHIGPAREYAPAQSPLAVLYRFAIRGGTNPWRRRVLQRGVEVYGVEDATLFRVRAHTKESSSPPVPAEPVAEPVLLTKFGSVLDSNRYQNGPRGMAAATATENPVPAYVEVDETAAAVWFRHKVSPELAFATLVI